LGLTTLGEDIARPLQTQELATVQRQQHLAVLVEDSLQDRRLGRRCHARELLTSRREKQDALRTRPEYRAVLQCLHGERRSVGHWPCFRRHVASLLSQHVCLGSDGEDDAASGCPHSLDVLR
jgi:hypothetical protein